MNNNLCAFGCSNSCCCLYILSPQQNQQLDRLEAVEGISCPCESITVVIDCLPRLCATADRQGRFRVEIPYTLSEGPHTIYAYSCPGGCCVCRHFCIQGRVPVPTVDTPLCGSAIADPAPWITGRGTPGYSVRVCLGGYGCQTVTVDESGEYRVNFGVQLPDGMYTLTVTQISPTGSESESVICSFTVDTSAFLIEPIDARMGASFRTVDVDVLVSGASGPATVYYLLLPPGSPAPTAAEVMNYSDTASLLNGSAATGQFQTTITQGQTLYTWALTGLDNPNAPAGTTGVIDGYNYDVYLYVVFAGRDSGVLTFGQQAMGMPYSSGLGTPDNPFTIRQLSPGELQMYPDLIAGNPLNEPGVDEYARMLENIERLITLYERTNGLHGLENSMALNYLMTSDIDLSNYAAAYGGEGWQSIGDIDGWINDLKETEHLFSGVFDGGGHTITNLSITPVATNDNFVGYRGLFGGVEEGTVKNLILSGVTIDAVATSPGNSQFGSFISISRNPVLSGLTLQNANIRADAAIPPIGDTHTVNVGGFVGEIFDGGVVSDIVGNGITITVPDASALALGGFAGFTDKFDAFDSFDNIQLSGITISGHAMIGGLIGYVVYGVNRVSGVTVSGITITAPGGEAGGLIGRLYTYSGTGDSLIENCSVQSVFINSVGAASGAAVGGLIGLLRDTPFALTQVESRVFGARAIPAVAAAWPMTTIRRCSVVTGQVNCLTDGGGLIGSLTINRAEAAQRVLVTLCKAVLSITALSENAGGLIGICLGITADQCFANCTVVSGGPAGGLIANPIDTNITNCYALGSVTGLAAAGGIAGVGSANITNCYFFGNVTAIGGEAGGIAGPLTQSVISGCLMLGGTVSGAAAHRIASSLGAGTTLLNNYALDTVIPVPAFPDPNGIDGGTITSAQIIATMQALGWNVATVWNTGTVAGLGRPTLIQNPE